MIKNTLLTLIISMLLCLTFSPVYAHTDGHTASEESSSEQAQEGQDDGLVTYLGNEALLVTYNATKVLFDPFFHNAYNSFQLVPEDIQKALFSGKPPYDNIDAIFISHAHGDHFSANDVHRYLTSFPNTQLVAPKQAVDEVLKLADNTDIQKRIVSLSLDYQDPPVNKRLENISFDAVRIPHAGWPQRADVANLVYRVSLDNKVTIMHLGDADANDTHFKPLIDHWHATLTHMVYPPFWFFTTEDGPMIINTRINARESIGVHVPIDVPEELRKSGADYFTIPGETRSLQTD